MDDPTRGVDVGTKEEIYKLILGEKKKGRSFVWYSTEVGELRYCDTTTYSRQAPSWPRWPATRRPRKMSQGLILMRLQRSDMKAYNDRNIT